MVYRVLATTFCQSATGNAASSVSAVRVRWTYVKSEVRSSDVVKSIPVMGVLMEKLWLLMHK